MSYAVCARVILGCCVVRRTVDYLVGSHMLISDSSGGRLDRVSGICDGFSFDGVSASVWSVGAVLVRVVESISESGVASRFPRCNVW